MDEIRFEIEWSLTIKPDIELPYNMFDKNTKNSGRFAPYFLD